MACSAFGDCLLLLTFPDLPSFCAQSLCAHLFALITRGFSFLFGPSAVVPLFRIAHPPPPTLPTFGRLSPTVLQCLLRGSLLHKTSGSPRRGPESCLCSQSSPVLPYQSYYCLPLLDCWALARPTSPPEAPEGGPCCDCMVSATLGHLHLPGC